MARSRRLCRFCIRGASDAPPAPSTGWSGGSLDRLAAIVESSDDAIITKTPAGIITSWNRAATRLFGYDAAEAIGRHITLLFPPERLAEEDEFIVRVTRGERVDHFETERVHKDGTRRVVSISLSPVRDQHGQIVEISKIVRDVTAQRQLEAARHRAEMALSESEERFRAMADAAPVLIWVSGTDMACTWFNQQWLAFVGRTMAQELDDGWTEGVHPEDLSRCLDVYGTAFAARRPFRMEYRLRRADGQYRWVIDSGVPRHTASGEFTGYIGSAIDITDTKEEIETTRAFFDSAAEGILITNSAGQILRVNTRLAQMFGYSTAELLGQPVDLLLPARLRLRHEQHRANYFSAPRARSMGTGLDLFGLRKDGVEFPVEISLTPVETAEGSLAMALVTDITERRSLEQATRQREKLATLATVSAGIAHELNNPIGIISSRIELMLQDAVSEPLPVQVVEDLEVLYRNTQRVTQIAKGLLSFARHAPDETVPVDINTVVDDTLLLLGRPLAKDGVEVRPTLDRALGPVLGNGNALQQVLTNLLLNARDAMPRGGEVRIETAEHPDRARWLRLTIADTGDGMPPEALGRIWEPFYTTKTSGTGLGLSVTHRIIREHGGAIEVQSAPGRGTTFTIILPTDSAR